MNPDESPWVWLEALDEAGTRLLPGIGKTLAAAGWRLGGEPEVHPGIALFGEPTEAVLDLIRRRSRVGLHRLLALALAPGALRNGLAWQVLAAGSADVLVWDGTDAIVAAMRLRLERWAEVDALVASPGVRKVLAGQCPSWRRVLRQIVEVARFTDDSMLLTGESGTGKELVARLIHELDPRPAKGDFVVLDCTTVVPELSGSEFFGHERGAFTHAVATRQGVFALAEGGTLFLDEVGELPLPLQAELLRVVQERTYKPVGSNVWKNANFRLICATNRDLAEEQERGAFRRDFYHRIASWTCRLPPLSERREDILPLARRFLEQALGTSEPPEFDPALVDYLRVRAYPGNVRELRQLVRRIAHRHLGCGPITVGDVPDDEIPRAAGHLASDWREGDLERTVRHALALGVSLREIGNGATEVAIRVALEDSGGNLQRAARQLGVTDRALQIRRAAERGIRDRTGITGADEERESPERTG